MYNCIFSAHCTEEICDQSCPILAETSYLLERNDIKMSSDVFKQSEIIFDKAKYCLRELEEKKFAVIEVKKTVGTADMIAYCAICENWRGSQLHCTVYNLRYSQYVDLNKSSWSSNKDTPDLDYQKIFVETSNILIISGMDYANFKDFESQMLLNIIQSREDNEKLTLIVSPNIDNLIGSGQFFTRLKQELKEAVIES